MTQEEKTDIWFALNYWANFIETGNICLSAEDAIRK